jgi:hypothetical protein
MKWLSSAETFYAERIFAQFDGADQLEIKDEPGVWMTLVLLAVQENVLAYRRGPLRQRSLDVMPQDLGDRDLKGGIGSFGTPMAS